MCLEIIAKEDCQFIIHYVPGAKCLTDPPMSLTGLLRQRRRWFNGSMFATFHVLFSMCRIWKRKVNVIRNLLFMFLYLYMIVQTILSFILVGLFYGAFSIFVRETMPNDDCPNPKKPANLVENIYLLFLGSWLLLSITVDVKWAESGFRAWSFGMGVFTIVMVVTTILYAVNVDNTANYAFAFIIVWMLSLSMPLIMNMGKLRTWDFVKGIFFSLFLSPTYVNVFTIYAISNIHDVSWGSRPANTDPVSLSAEKKKEEEYKNYRANFLVFWILWNVGTGFGLITLSRNGNSNTIFYIGLGLSAVVSLKIILSIFHLLVTFYHDWSVKRMIRRAKKSNVFNDVQNNQNPEGNLDIYFYVKQFVYLRNLEDKLWYLSWLLSIRTISLRN